MSGATQVISCTNIDVMRSGRLLVKHASLAIAPGERVALIGPNGAGKSSLLRVLCGEIKPDRGSVSLHAKPLSQWRDRDVAKVRAVLPQNFNIPFAFTAREVVELGRFPHARKPSADEAGIVHAAMRATRVDALAHRVIHTLSGGERARAQLARVLAQIWEPTVEKNSPDKSTRWLLLDEPTAALDLSHQHDVLRLVRQWAKERGVGVVAVLHDVNLALRYADSVVVMKNGALVCHGTPADALNAATVSEVYNVKVQAVRDDAGVAQLLVA